MTYNKIFLCLFGISAYYIIGSVARVAIIGGTKARANQLPYMVSIQNDGGHICGGALVRDKFILTAAHCVVDHNLHLFNERMFIIAGATQVNGKGEIVHVTRIFVPKEYKGVATSGAGDIAVLELKDSLPETHNLKHLKLPRKREVYAHKTARIAGYGWNMIDMKGSQELDGKSDGYLRYAEADVLTNAKCQEGYKRQRISDKHVCARIKQEHKEHRGVCTDDSGSPLVFESKVILGVLSISPLGCTEKSAAGVYTRVTRYLEFIAYAFGDKKVEVPGGVHEFPLHL